MSTISSSRPVYFDHPSFFGRLSAETVSQAILGVMNNVSPNVRDLPLDTHPTGQAPDRRESDFSLFGLHPPSPDYSDLGG